MIATLLFAVLGADVNIDAIASDAQGRVGAAAVVMETGRQLIDYHADEQYPMQSVYKLPIAMAAERAIILRKVRRDDIVHVNRTDYVRPGQHSPLRDENPNGADVTVMELMRLAVSESDGSASDAVMKLVGGPKGVMDYLARRGIGGITVHDSEKQIGADWAVQYANSASPDAAIMLLRAASSRKLLMKWMTETTTSSTRIKGLLPKGTVVAHKTGSSGAKDGITAATNDIGIAILPDGRHLAIAVFVADSKADDATRDGVIARIARAAWDTAIEAGKLQ